MFGHDWQQAEATVVKTAIVPVHKHDANFHTVYVVEVHPAEGEPFRAELAQPEWGPHFGFPQEGHVIGVRFERKSRKVKWDHSDPRSFQLGKNPQQEAIDAALRAPVGSPPPEAS
jgi:hypothetical protein